MKVDNLYKKPNGNIGVIVGQAPIENLVFEGGGPKGLVYVGALEVLDAKGILGSIKNIGGSSAGAITALAIGLGNSAAQSKKIIYDLNIGEMTDLTNKEITGPFSGLIKVKEGLSNLLFESQKKGKGIYLGDKLQDWLKDMIRSRLQYALTLEENRNSQRYQLASTLCEKEEVTFADLAQLSKLFPELNMKGMCFTGTNYTDQTLDVFNVHETPDMPVTLAIRISVSLPWFFKSIKYNGKEYMDGGCLDNYPMGIFDAPPFKPTEKLKLTSGEYGQNLCTLGFKVDSTEEIRKVLWEGRQEDNTGFFGQLLQGVKDKVTDLCVGVNNTEANKATNKAVYGKYAQRTVQIPDLEYSTFNFDLTNEDKDKLALAGKKATLEWFSLYYDGAGIELELNDVQELSSYLSNEEFAAVKKRALDL